MVPPPLLPACKHICHPPISKHLHELTNKIFHNAPRQRNSLKNQRPTTTGIDKAKKNSSISSSSVGIVIEPVALTVNWEALHFSFISLSISPI
jgi:hypothetical protein